MQIIKRPVLNPSTWPGFSAPIAQIPEPQDGVRIAYEKSSKTRVIPQISHLNRPSLSPELVHCANGQAPLGPLARLFRGVQYDVWPINEAVACG